MNLLRTTLSRALSSAAVRVAPAPTAEQAERFITGYRFPGSVLDKLRLQHPELTDDDLMLIGAGLQEWLVTCVYRDGAVVGMPSRAVDWAWHQFILNTPAYAAFCQQAYGSFLHHTPESSMDVPMRQALANTVRAWDASRLSRVRETVMWDLDLKLGVRHPLSPDADLVASARR